MKKILFSIMFLGMMLVIADEATAQNCRPNANQIAVFYDANYQGRCVVRNVGTYSSVRSTGLPNDSISSIIVGRNVTAVLCRDVNFRGTCETFSSSDSFLGNNRIGNDQVSSIRVIRRRTNPPPVQNCRPNANQIALFYDANYRGRCVLRNIGGYPSVSSTGLPNDSISSIIVGQNVRAVLCRDVNYRGTCESFAGNVANLGNSRIGNDQVSSVQVLRRGGNPVRHAPPNSRYRYCAAEGGRCSFRGTGIVAYGVNGRFQYRRNVRGNIACTNSVFGDPAPGLPKRCYYFVNSNSVSVRHVPPNSRYRFCASEGERCNFRGRSTVAFGVNGRFRYKSNVSGGVVCNTRNFGDPTPGLPKRCYVLRN
jgi:hypothetical protein